MALGQVPPDTIARFLSNDWPVQDSFVSELFRMEAQRQFWSMWYWRQPKDGTLIWVTNEMSAQLRESTMLEF